MSTEVADAGLSITERAAEEVLDLLEAEGLSPDEAGLRLFVKQGGCAGLSYGLRFDTEAETDDRVFEAHGVRVFVDQASLQYVTESTLDFEGGLQGEGFYVDNPNVVSECGCGESFRT
ncbi:MAG: HesB/IscA family protein [Halobacteriales archaeon]